MPGIGSRALIERLPCGVDKARRALAAALDREAIEDRPEPRGKYVDHHFYVAHVSEVSDT